MKAPAFQFYADDFLAGTIDMSPAEVGAYIRLLCYQWSNGSIPADLKKLRRIAGGPVSPEVLAKFVPVGDGRLANKRLELERQKQAEFREKQRQKGIQSGAARRAGAEPRLNHGSAPCLRRELAHPRAARPPSPVRQLPSAHRARVPPDRRGHRDADLLQTHPDHARAMSPHASNRLTDIAARLSRLVVPDAEAEARRQRQQEGEQAVRALELWGRADVPRRHAERALRPGPQDPTSAWTQTRTRVLAMLGQGVTLCLTGTRGNGKTQLGVEAILATTLNGNPALFRTAQRMFMESKGSFNDEAVRNELQVLDSLRRPRLLVLDEIGQRTESGWENRTFFEVLNARYNDTTYLVECLAGEAGVPVVKLKNFRDKWVGSTESNLERIFRLIAALAKRFGLGFGSEDFPRVRDQLPLWLTPGAAEVLATKVFRTARTQGRSTRSPSA